MIAAVFDSLAWALALALCVPGLRGRPARAVAVVLASTAGLWLPVAGTSALAALRGAVGSPSVTTLVVLAALLLAHCGRTVPFAGGERMLIAALAGCAGVLFYPPALGLGPLDPYAWGYGTAALPLAVGALAFLGGAAGRWVLAGALSLALAAWRLRLLESTNLWDYLIDPLLALGSLIALAVYALRTKSAKRAGCSRAAARSSANAADAR